MLKRDLKLYLVDSVGSQYELPIYYDVSYSQVYSESTRANKTLHNPENTFETAYTTYLNPGNFSFTIPVMHDSVFQVLFQVLMGPTPYDLYIEKPGSSLKLQKCVADSIVFNTEQKQLITASISGSYSLTNTDTRPAEPSILESSSIYTVVGGLQITRGGVVDNNIANFSIEFSRDVEWVNRNFMHDTTPSNSVDFVVSRENLSGNYSIHEEMAVPQFGTDTLNILIHSGGEELLQFDFPSVTFTTRGQLDEILKTGVDYKVNLDANNQVLYKGVNIL